MPNNGTTSYWLFQSNPKWLNLKAALRAEVLRTFPVRAHKVKIRPGDKVILWQTGKEAGCYALCTVSSQVNADPPMEEEAAYYLTKEWDLGVKLAIDYNLWDRPLTPELLPKSLPFKRFFAGRPGTNFRSSAAQYEQIEHMVRQIDVVNEAEVEYRSRPPVSHPLNFILYGPPGTGKTYYTVNYALSIIENRSLEELALEDRQALKRRFEEYKDEGQIHFVSFHQSYTYEDFVEGIKPRSRNGKVSYVIEDGIFKMAALEARRSIVEELLQSLPRQVIAVDYHQLYKSFLDYLKTEDFDVFMTRKNRKIFLHKVLKFGNISVRPDKSFAVVNVTKNRLRKMYKQFSQPDPGDKQDQALRQLLGKVNTGVYWAVFDELKKFEQNYLQELADQSEEEELEGEELEVIELDKISEQIILRCCKHVLIIDEINRGHMASIFGELISLIDEDKREGGQEVTEVILPYSKTVFSIPPNLFIIGTMNTTDRSIATMDLAMRRRFTFIEMMPQPGLIHKLAPAPITAGIDLPRMLEVINERITLLLDRDYQIGHAYFLDVRTFHELKKLFAEKILPLLQEYFYGDFSKIGLVLGRAFLQKKHYASQDIFADFDHEYASELEDKSVYFYRPIEELKEADFIRIYDSQYKE